MSKHKLLLADDSITIQKVVNLTFADEGVEVVSVSDGNAALEKLSEFTPDLVMADINMPGINGYEICEHIKQNAETSRIPVILLVGSFEPFDEEEAGRVGANDFLTKPFQSIRQLVTKVTGLLESEKDRTSTDEIISDLETSETAAMPGEFEDTLEMPHETLESEEFGDSGLDDEMIQANQVGGLEVEEAQQFQSRTENETEDFAKTQPFTNDDINEIRSFQTSEQTETENQTESTTDAEERGYAFVGEIPLSHSLPSQMEDEYSLAETEPLTHSASFYETQPPINSDAELELDEGNLLELPPSETSSPIIANSVWQEEIAPLDQSFEMREEIAEPEAAETPSAEISEEITETEIEVVNQFTENEEAEQSLTEEISEESSYKTTEEISGNVTDYSFGETVEEAQIENEPEEISDDEPQAEFDEFSDQQSAESENVESEDSEETAITNEDETEETEAETDVREAVTAEMIDVAQVESVETEENTVIEETSEEVSETAAEPLNLSPAVIDAIAAKVAERFSDSVIREIVAEVTPQITDLIARRIAEENPKE